MITQPLFALEVSWALCAVAGVFLSAWMLRNLYGDRRDLTRYGLNGLKRTAATGGIRTEWLRLYVLVALLVVGALAVITPNAPQETFDPLQWFFRLILMSVNLGIVGTAISDHLLRLSLIHGQSDEDAKMLLDDSRRRHDSRNIAKVLDGQVNAVKLLEALVAAGVLDSDALDRIEQEEVRVAVELTDTQHRADEVIADPNREAGEAADEASSSPPEARQPKEP